MSPAKRPTVLFVLHSRVHTREPAVTASRECLEKRGHAVHVFHRHASEDRPGRSEGGWHLEPAQLEGVELVVTFGGDGTFLHAARTAIHAGIPLVGVNFGRLGFLAWTPLEEAPDALCAWSDGTSTVETRATLQVHIDGQTHLAINEAALLKDPAANVIQLEISADGATVGMFHADGVVIATPTGSTAYAVSAGGPIVHPGVTAVVMAPLNPHTLASRALVLPADQAVLVRVNEATRLLLDGATSIDVASNSTLRCTLDGPLLRLVRLPGNPDFYTQLREKLRWGEPLVREGRR